MARRIPHEMRPRKPKRVAPRVVDINGGDDVGREREGGGIGDDGGLAVVVDGTPGGWQVRWIHKILADGPQNDDTLLFQANGGQIPSDRGPGCGPGSFGTGNATYS